MTTKTTGQRLNDLEAEAWRTGRSLADLHEAVRGVAADTELIAPMANRLGRMEEDVASVRSDVHDIKRDVAGLKTDVAGLKADMTEVKSALAAIMGHLGIAESPHPRP